MFGASWETKLHQDRWTHLACLDYEVSPKNFKASARLLGTCILFSLQSQSKELRSFTKIAGHNACLEYGASLRTSKLCQDGWALLACLDYEASPKNFEALPQLL